MGVSEILIQIDREIAQLQEARAILCGATAPKPKRPATTWTAKMPVKKKRNLSAEGRRRIAEGVKRRWAAQKKGPGPGH